MNRNEKFYLIMAIVYSVTSLGVLVLVIKTGAFSGFGILLMLLAVICAAAQWLRFRKAHAEARGIVRKKRIPKFVPMPEKAEPEKVQQTEEKHEAD